MNICPVCGNAVTLPGAAEIIISREGIHGERVECSTCLAVYSVVTRVLHPSPLADEQLEKIRSQPRG
jgi:hypothetical protein